MRINTITAENFQGLRAVDLRLTVPVAMFAGRNYAGKSSLQEAIRMALTGESVRVDLKKEYGALVTEGRESGFVEVGTDNGAFSIVLPTGKGTHSDAAALPYVLDAQRFARLSEADRRAFLFGLMGLSAGGASVKERLLKRECDPAKIEATMPLLRAGFAAACDEAKGKARDAKAAWRTVTGETYGSVKAASWKAGKPDFNADSLAKARAMLSDSETQIETATKQLGDLEGRDRQHKEHAGKLANLKEQAGKFARIQEKLNKDEAELKERDAKIAALPPKAGTKPQTAACPECGAVLCGTVGGGLTVWTGASAEADSDVEGKRGSYSQARDLMARAVANGKRDLEASEAAARALRELEESGLAEAPAEEEITAAREKLATLKHDRKNHEAAIQLLQDAERKAGEADKKTADAARHHADVAAWEKIADALAPDGIPGEMLAEALGPINARLAQSAADAEWQTVEIAKDMAVRAGGRAYALLSESEKWRADAMIAEAIANLSGLRLIVLDRFDVLDIKGREDLLYWLDALAEQGEIDTALIFGTLKGLPAQLPARIEGFWIENGVAGSIQQAA